MHAVFYRFNMAMCRMVVAGQVHSRNVSLISHSSQVRNILQSISPAAQTLESRRTLFSKESLGLESYERNRVEVSERLGATEEGFKEQLRGNLGSADKGMVFSDDLKVMLHIASSDQDLTTVRDMVLRFNEQNRELRFSTFQFGPVVMRLLHFSRRPDLALELFLDNSLGEFFGQMSSAVVLQDLLLESGCYTDVMAVHEALVSRGSAGLKLPTDCLTLTAAAAFCLNTAEAHDKLRDVLQQAKSRGAVITPRSLCFAAALALNQGSPSEALLAVDSLETHRNILAANIKQRALLSLGQGKTAAQILRNLDMQEIPHHVNHKILLPDTVEAFESAAEQDDELKQEITPILKSLQAKGRISGSTLGESLRATVVRRTRAQAGFQHRPRTQPQWRRNNWEGGRKGLMRD